MNFYNLLLSFFLLFTPFISEGQILSNVTLNLNAGGVVHDMKYDGYKNAYIVVGEFDSIQGVARKNLAFIDATTFSVTTDNPIASINGAIRTVAWTRRVQWPNNYDYLYLGGDFTLVNGVTHVYMARLAALEPIFPPFVTTYNLDSWDALIVNQGTHTAYGVTELALNQDTIVAVGHFTIFAPDHGLTQDQFGIAAFDADANSADLYHAFYPMPSPFTPGVQMTGITYAEDGYYYIHGDAPFSSIKRLNSDGTHDASAFYSLTGTEDDVYDAEVVLTESDTIVYLAYEAAGINTGIVDLYYHDGPNPNFINGGNSDQDITHYKNYIFGADLNSDVLNTYKQNGGYSVTLENTIPINNNWVNWSQPLLAMRYDRMHVVNDKLFLSGESMTSVDGQYRRGLAMFCLEPKDPEDFTVFDTTICEGNTKIYTIPQADYATGYRWSYTGIGAMFRVDGSGAVFQPLTDSTVLDVSANSIEIEFGPGTTGGILTVQPFSTCNGPTDYVFSGTKSLNLMTAPLPDLVVVEDTMSFTCVRDSFYMIGQSVTPGVTWSWEHNLSVVGSDDSMYVHLNDGIIDSTYHYVYVTEPINDCQSSDSVFIVYDTTAVQILLTDLISTPPVFDCTVDSLTLTSTVPDAVINWALQSAPNDSVPDQFTIYDANDSLQVWLYATYNSNGCTAQQDYTIAVDQVTLPGGLTGYSNFGSVVIIDSLSCNNPTLDLECNVTGNGTTDWIIGGTPSGDQLNLTVADSAGMNVFNTNSYQFITSNNDNGCVDTSDVTVKFDFETPFIASYNGPASLNCSATDLLLVHTETGGTVIEGWLDGMGIQTNDDSLLITSIGEYYYEVENASNGCSAIDTVEVVQTMEMFLEMPDDTLICSGQSIDVTPISINNSETTSYTWSNGDTTQTVSLIGGLDAVVSVIAITTSGCTAYDTILVLVNPDITADLIASSGCSDGALQVSNVSGGGGSYEYSLNQVDWQQNPAFTGLSFGTHTVFIKDDLDCIFSFDETIGSGSSGLDVNFLVSTYNSEGDTLAIVNISNFTGFDSLEWVVPGNASVYSDEDSMIVLSIPDGGWYDITLIGYQDTCAYSFTKPVFFGDETPVFEDDHNAVGVQQVTVYPNPTSGNFTVDVEFGIEQNYTIVITNAQGQPVPGMTVNGTGIVISESFSFPIGVPTGPYMVHIICDFDAEQETIILN